MIYLHIGTFVYLCCRYCNQALIDFLAFVTTIMICILLFLLTQPMEGCSSKTNQKIISCGPSKKVNVYVVPSHLRYLTVLYSSSVWKEIQDYRC